ncbi:mitogen-activated protein kinase kinase kinase 14 [Fundulus heteroclitus]|uniref:mitogen-activated protein kinase kinase kinase 14 n=1 Tax=Fundulus heteroclitus TaxID=8078 RepID=UPI00165B060A|nr:mitogen-activated protein kinase kinase kinase 14 [Fundulus heteroclitus]XP_035997956.1 mitogen-activated protein kinase kinase kinase 14 [Fundulus heteroclitus]XP_035997957.1 mitogen-activated protein kinase kinase kinase 14 [Fundulus heteroclitus]
MAIPRMFSSKTPFIVVTGGSEHSFLGKEESSQGCEEETDSLVQAIGPHLTHVMQHGTAKHVIKDGLEGIPCVSIVAQAEREDFQEFSPSSTLHPYPQLYLLQKHRSLSEEAALICDTEDEDLDEVFHQHLHRKQRRKPRSKLKTLEEGGEPPVIQGLWVQEIDWLKATLPAEIIPPPPQFTDSCCPLDSCKSGQTDVSSSSDDRQGSDCESVFTQESGSDSSYSAAADQCELESDMSDPNSDLTHVSGFHSDWDSGSSECARSLQEIPISDSSQMAFTFNKSDSEFDELKGRVKQIPKLFISTFFINSMKQILDSWTTTKPANEGLIFHHLLQPNSFQYREGEEYVVLHHIQNGSYGDVFCVRDKSTGFKCAAKRIPLSHFSCDEVKTWSALNTPRVVELFGAVRDGLSVILFMDLKPACLAQLLKEMTCLPEDLALHYLHQTLGALEHLHHRKVLHLDVKADNVLLSADCRDTFLCDFGLSEMLDDSGRSTKAFRGAAFPGTETHMAPEVARGDQACPKADVWSSCCMLLHMLNGCQPWIRYYTHPLCLQIVNGPPPLWEVPSNCNNFTAKVFRAGLQKDPDRRASAKDLRRKTTKALRAVGGLSPSSLKTASDALHHGQREDKLFPPKEPSSPSHTASTDPAALWVSPWRTVAVDEDNVDVSETDSITGEWDSHPRPLRDQYADEGPWETGSESEVDIYMAEEEECTQEKLLKTDKDYEGDWEEEEEEDEEWDSSDSTEYLRTLRGLFPLLRRGLQTDEASWGSEAELEYLRDDVPVGTTVQTPSPEPRDEPPSCFSCSDTSQIDEDSEHSSDDLSSGVFSSCNSHSSRQLVWIPSADQPYSRCFEGVDIWIENIQGECFRIRERRRVKVGHVAIGISDQISGKTFTLETLDRKTVSFEDEIREPGSWFRCVPAPDRCQRWSWRVQDGKLELRE